MDNIYPVGSIFISTSTTNPSEYFGGVWEEIQGRFLVGRFRPSTNSDNYFGDVSGIAYNILPGTTGGQDFHTLTTSEIPAHSHRFMRPAYYDAETANDSTIYSPYGYKTSNHYNSWTAEDGGSGARHNNMPPYYGVVIWRRLS